MSAPRHRIAKLAAALAEGQRGAREVYATACEVARRLAERLGLPEDVQRALLQAFERWDGKGFPAGAAGDEICRPARVVALARDAEVFTASAARRRRSTWCGDGPARRYDPTLAAVFCDSAAELLAGLDEPWEVALAAEPAPRRHVRDEQLDPICRAIADFADLKTPVDARSLDRCGGARRGRRVAPRPRRRRGGAAPPSSTTSGASACPTRCGSARPADCRRARARPPASVPDRARPRARSGARAAGRDRGAAP